MSNTSPQNHPHQESYDVVVVGAGLAGLYAVHRFRKEGLSVLCIEGADGVGGVWYHNRYPGARVDVDSVDYSYYFSPELYREWRWSERFASQPELLRYFEHVADRFDLRKDILFGNWVTEARWDEQKHRYCISTSQDRRFTCRFLVMCTGPLSAARKPPFPGLDKFRGEWVQTSHWPQREVRTAGRRIAVIGTGSSGVQVSTELAGGAEHLYVFQRSPNFVVPAQNRPLDESTWNHIKDRIDAGRDAIWISFGEEGNQRVLAGSPANDARDDVGTVAAPQLSAHEQQRRLEAQWVAGGSNMKRVFSDQNSSLQSNDIVSDFIREKIRSTVKDPILAETLCPYDHPMGTRRLILADGYYDIFNRDNVTLVDVSKAPIERFTETGIQTADGHYEVDLVVFALGFDAFTGAIDGANIRNTQGRGPTDHWKRGPRTLLGLMTSGFPNLLFVSGAGSPSVLYNLFALAEYQLDWIADCIAYMRRNGYATIEASEDAEERWSAHVTEVASHLLRLNTKNYMAQHNDDGSRVFKPYAGGKDRYFREVAEIVANGYEGFRFGD